MSSLIRSLKNYDRKHEQNKIKKKTKKRWHLKSKSKIEKQRNNDL